MIGKRVSGGVGLELEIPVNVNLDVRINITWVKNSFEKSFNELHVKVKKCVKQKHLFSSQFIGCLLVRGKFCPKYSRGVQKSLRYNKCPL